MACGSIQHGSQVSNVPSPQQFREAGPGLKSSVNDHESMCVLRHCCSCSQPRMYSRRPNQRRWCLIWIVHEKTVAGPLARCGQRWRSSAEGEHIVHPEPMGARRRPGNPFDAVTIRVLRPWPHALLQITSTVAICVNGIICCSFGF